MSGRLRHYACGSTAHDTRTLFRGGTRDVREFPSGVFLYEPGDGRRFLFDTGYAPDPWPTGWRTSVYRRVLPPSLAPGDDIGAQLARDGVDPDSIGHVILSHLHPDHVGGLKSFPRARLVITSGQLETDEKARVRDAVLPGLLPAGFPGEDPIVLTPADFAPVTVAGRRLRVAEPWAGAGIRLVDLPGHARGHLGALVEDRVLLAGDAAWGTDLLDAAPRMRALPRRLQHHPAAYAATARTLSALSAQGIRIVCSHDRVVDRELLP
ncbi:MBL fold metallo-hydrolase [uncultured Microbacterium sp.]|uniref:MBL fold metallo-hydrolase n=1 Tax=uncultured Microbacterium sp. TaxID=191216 RepID=UPI0025F03FF6|nr:MBL fold metallo-hydrolase [uncultured Microbacterium sp.]